MFNNYKTVKLGVEEPFTNRSRLGIIYQILSICSTDHISQTKLMYKANLSYFQLKKYVKTLTLKELLRETISNGKKSYIITAKGHQFIEAFRQLSRLLSDTKPIYSRF